MPRYAVVGATDGPPAGRYAVLEALPGAPLGAVNGSILERLLALNDLQTGLGSSVGPVGTGSASIPIGTSGPARDVLHGGAGGSASAGSDHWRLLGLHPMTPQTEQDVFLRVQVHTLAVAPGGGHAYAVVAGGRPG